MEEEIESRSSGLNHYYWTAFEESVDGECETSYELNEIPNSVVVDQKILPKPELCPRDGKVYELVKSRNVNNCLKRSSYTFYKPGGFTCKRGGNCGGMWARSSVTRYTVCGTPENYIFQRIVNEGEMNQDLLGFKSEKML